MNQPTDNKVTADSIHARLANIRFTRLPDETTTVCSIRMVNGFDVHGTSNCVDPANFDAVIGERVAFNEAFDKLWALEGYLLKEKLYQQRLTEQGEQPCPSPTQE